MCFPGCLPNIARNAIVNCAELVTYDIIKELILTHKLMTGEHKHSPADPRGFQGSFRYCFFFFPSVN